MANRYGNRQSFVKMQAENSVIKKMSHKKRYTPEFFGYIFDRNFFITQTISMNFGRYLQGDMIHLQQQK